MERGESMCVCACAHVLCGILTVYSIEEFGWRVRIRGGRVVLGFKRWERHNRIHRTQKRGKGCPQTQCCSEDEWCIGGREKP